MKSLSQSSASSVPAMKTMASVSFPAGVGGAGEGGAEVETEYCHPHEHRHAGVVTLQQQL